jgi:hypothetical protein
VRGDFSVCKSTEDQEAFKMKKGDVCFFVLSFSMLMFAHPLSSFAIERDDVSSLGCSDGIVDMGDSKSDVLEKCGEPTRKEGFREHLWVYDFGSSHLVYYLTFSRDRLERIQTGGYGN